MQADAQEEEDAEEAQKGPRMYANGVGLVKTLLSAAQLRAAKAALTPAELDVEMRHRQGAASLLSACDGSNLLR